MAVRGVGWAVVYLCVPRFFMTVKAPWGLREPRPVYTICTAVRDGRPDRTLVTNWRKTSTEFEHQTVPHPVLRCRPPVTCESFVPQMVTFSSVSHHSTSLLTNKWTNYNVFQWTPLLRPLWCPFFWLKYLSYVHNSFFRSYYYINPTGVNSGLRQIRR